jgi:hypothetical protein
MNREVHVRFWESPEVKVLRVTQHGLPCRGHRREWRLLPSKRALPVTPTRLARPSRPGEFRPSLHDFGRELLDSSGRVTHPIRPMQMLAPMYVLTLATRTGSRGPKRTNHRDAVHARTRKLFCWLEEHGFFGEPKAGQARRPS